MKTLIQKDTCTPMFTAALFIIVKIRKQPKCPSTDKWIKMCDIYKMMEYYSALKQKILQVIALSGIGKETKDKHCMISLTHGI